MTQQISIDALKSMSVIELQELGDTIHRALVRKKLRGQALQDAIRSLQMIQDEIESRPLPLSLEQACGLEPDADLPETWSPNALSDAERMIAEYCAAHNMTYAEFRKKVDAWLAQQDAKPQATMLPRQRRRFEHGVG